MNNVGLLELLLVLPFPVWPVLMLWVFKLTLLRKIPLWAGLLAALIGVALAVGFYQVFSQLQQPDLARIAAIIYGGMAPFFLIITPALILIPRDCAVNEKPAGKPTVGNENSSASGDGQQLHGR